MMIEKKGMVDDRPTPDIHPHVSVIIVNYNAGELLTDCVRSVLRSDLSVEVIVADNGSGDDSIVILHKLLGNEPRLRIIENGANLGFSTANNIALPYARADFVLFLNPDCLVEPDTIPRMIEQLKNHPDAGMATCLIRNQDGSEQAGCRRMTPTPWRTFVRILHLDRLFRNNPKYQGFNLNEAPLPMAPIYIEALSGAFMLVKREALNQVGTLDEGYFIHCEDLDWCYRFSKAGWKVLFVPNVAVIHVKGACSSDQLHMINWHKHKGMVRFYRKFFRDEYPAPFMWFVIAAIWGRYALKSVALLFRSGTDNNA